MPGPKTRLRSNSDQSYFKTAGQQQSPVTVVPAQRQNIVVDLSVTELHKAVIAGNLDAVLQQLVQNRLNINAASNHLGKTALHLAVEYGHLHIVKFLLARKDLNVNTPDIHGNTALHLAVMGGRAEAIQRPKETLTNYAEIIKELVAAKGIDVNAQNDEGKTAEHCLVERSDYKNALFHIANYERIHGYPLKEDAVPAALKFVWASYQYIPKIQMLLIAQPKFDNTKTDNLGKTASGSVINMNTFAKSIFSTANIHAGNVDTSANYNEQTHAQYTEKQVLISKIKSYINTLEANKKSLSYQLTGWLSASLNDTSLINKLKIANHLLRILMNTTLKPDDQLKTVVNEALAIKIHGVNEAKVKAAIYDGNLYNNHLKAYLPPLSQDKSPGLKTRVFTR